MLAIVGGAVLGIICGLIFGKWILVFSFLGTLFLNAVKMMILPLTVSAMIIGVASLGDVRKFGRLGATTIIYFLATTGIAVVLGLVLVLIIQPGAPVDTGGAILVDQVAGKEYSIVNVLLGLVNPNLVQAAMNLDILPLVVISLLFGGVLTTLGATGKPVIHFFDGLFHASMMIVRMIIWFAPIGVFALISTKIAQEGGGAGFWNLLITLGLYAFTVLLGLGIHGFVILPAILKTFTGRNPQQFVRQCGEALLTAFSTSSSSATLPVTLEVMEHNAKVSNRITGIVIPVGATINMNGTALYEAVAAVFIAQAYGIHLNIFQIVIVFIMATLAAIGAAGIPEAGLVTMIMVLKAVGLPLEGISLLLPIDWFLDRCRTTVNVFGDCVGAAVVEKLAPQHHYDGGAKDPFGHPT